MDYLVTGAAGFIGSAVARKLIQLGHKVTTIDNLSTGLMSNIPDCTFIEGNTYDKSVINKLGKFDAIIHIAGQSSGEVSYENPVYDLQTNTQSTVMLLDHAKRTGCDNFIYASSMSVYGDQVNVNELTPVHPKSFYAVGKLASERYMELYGSKATALRLFNVYGKGQNMSNLKQGMFSIFLAMAIKDKHIVVKGSKDRFRDFVHIDDVVDAFMKSLSRTTDGFEVYNISSGKSHTVESLVNILDKYLNVTVEYVDGTLGDQHGIYGNSNKAYSELNWKANTPFDDGAKEMIDWAIKESL